MHAYKHAQKQIKREKTTDTGSQRQENQIRRFLIFYPFTGQVCSSQSNIARVYVARRHLSFLSFKRRSLAHSALVLEMADGKSCLLEYMGDGKVHLYDIGMTSEWDCRGSRGDCHIEMEAEGQLYRWTRQNVGAPMTVQVTPQSAKDEMQEISGNDYDFIGNNCHMGQENLRIKWGLGVRRPCGRLFVRCRVGGLSFLSIMFCVIGSSD